MTTLAGEGRRRHVMITDLDLSDELPQPETAAEPPPPQHKARKKRQTAKTLHTITGNFSRRSRSAECRVEQPVGGGDDTQSEPKRQVRVTNYFNNLLQAKEKQMNQLLQRLATLHKFNEQFANENEKLHAHTQTLDAHIKQLKLQLDECPNCRQLTQQLSEVTEEQRQLSTDLEMMKTLVYRLNVQIESYQDRLRLAKKDEVVDTGGGGGGDAQMPSKKSSILDWRADVLHTHTLGPLLLSYDEMLCDKEELIQQYRHEFEHFTGELKRVIEENNRLLQQNETQRRDVGAWREERTRLQAQVEVCRTRAEAQTRKSDLAKEKLVEVMHCYEQKMQTLALDMEHLQSAYARCKTELAALKSCAAQPADSISQALQECKTLLEQLKEQHSKEKHAMEQTIADLTNQRSSSLTKTVNLKQHNTALSKEVEQLRATVEELQRKATVLQRTAEKVKRSRDRLKARLRIALQWAQKLEAGQANLEGTWDALKRLETIVKHKESQVRGLHARHLQEIEQMQKKLTQKEETIRTILKGKLGTRE